MAKDEWKKEGTSAMKAAAYFSSDSVGRGSVAVLLDMIAGKDVQQETAVDAIIVLVTAVATPFLAGITGLLYADQRIRRERFDLDIARTAAPPS